MGVNPGPMLIQDEPTLFWSVIISMYIGNVILLILNLPLIPYIAKILKIPKPMLLSLLTMFCLVGVYSLSFNTFDLYLLLIFCLIGYFMTVLNFPPAPFIISFILGGMMEQSLRKAMTISNGSLSIFIERPISLGLLVVTVLTIITPPIVKFIKKKKQYN